MIWIVIIIIAAAICFLLSIDEFFAKMILTCVVVAIACTLLSWITGLELFMILVKICGVAIVLAILIPIIRAIF